MSKAARDPLFEQEASHGLGITRSLAGKHFQRELVTRALVTHTIDAAATACMQTFDHPVAIEALAFVEYRCGRKLEFEAEQVFHFASGQAFDADDLHRQIVYATRSQCQTGNLVRSIIQRCGGLHDIDQRAFGHALVNAVGRQQKNVAGRGVDLRVVDRQRLVRAHRAAEIASPTAQFDPVRTG